MGSLRQKKVDTVSAKCLLAPHCLFDEILQQMPMAMWVALVLDAQERNGRGLGEFGQSGNCVLLALHLVEISVHVPVP